jgi:probable O-glycosylation ligase (exosortase A-associated)
MLRLIFVFSIVAFGLFQSIQSPFYALAFYLWIAYFRPDQWVWSSIIRESNLSFIVGLIVVAGTFLSAPRLRLSGRVLLLFLFVAQTIVSAVFSQYPWRCWPAIEDFVRVALISYLIVVLADDERKLRLLILIIAVSLGFEGAKQGWAGTILNPGGKNGNAYSFLGDENGVALGMMMLAPLFVALARTAERPWERWLHRVFLIGVVLRGITTYSRGGFVTAGVLGLFYVLLGQHRMRNLLAVAFLCVSVSIVMPQSFWNRMETITASEEERDSSAVGRLHYWRVAVLMGQANPLTGVGYNAFSSAYDTYDPSRGAFLVARAAHSAWFAVLGEMGFVGLALFVGLIGSSLFVCDSLRRRAGRNPQLRHIQYYATALEGSLISYSVAGTFLSAHMLEMFWHFIGLTMALSTVAAAAEAKSAAAVQTAPPKPDALWRVPQPVSLGARQAGFGAK